MEFFATSLWIFVGEGILFLNYITFFVCSLFFWSLLYTSACVCDVRWTRYFDPLLHVHAFKGTKLRTILLWRRLSRSRLRCRTKSTQAITMSAVILYGMKGTTFSVYCIPFSLLPPLFFLSSLSLPIALSLRQPTLFWYAWKHVWLRLRCQHVCMCAWVRVRYLSVSTAGGGWCVCVCGSISTLNDGNAHMSHVTFPFFFPKSK